MPEGPDVPVSEATYRKLAEEDFESGWELVCGRLRQKPGMTLRHNTLAASLGYLAQNQLSPSQYRASANAARLRLPGGTHYIPDLVIVPTATMQPHLDETGVETYPEPLPLVVEVWSPSTGGYDVETKLAEYQQRGDLEIWRVDPRDRSLTAWVRRPDGGYDERRYARRAKVRCAALPLTIDLDELFRLAWL